MNSPLPRSPSPPRSALCHIANAATLPSKGEGRPHPERLGYASRSRQHPRRGGARPTFATQVSQRSRRIASILAQSLRQASAKENGLFPFVQLKRHSGEQYPMTEAFAEEITKLYEGWEQEREAKRALASLLSQQGSEVIASASRTLPHLQQVPGPARRRRHCLLCRRISLRTRIQFAHLPRLWRKWAARFFVF